MATDLKTLTCMALITALEKQRDGVVEYVSPLSEQELWAKPVDPGNSIGHLVLHLTGNLNHFVGAQLGNTGYRRDREREFTEARPPAKVDLLAGLNDAVAMFRRVVSGLDEERLTQSHPESRFGTVMEALVHLIAHFSLHRGQISYLVRLVKKS